MALLGGLYTSNAFAGTTVSLRESYAGNLSFELTGASFRTTQNNVSACTFSSSASNVLNTLPIGADIEKAYLYWAASSDGISTDNQVTLNGITVTADRMYTEDTGTWDFFNGVADITNIISTYGNTTYTLTDLDIYYTASHCSTQTALGGWAIMVIYEDDNEPFRVLNVYEGFEYFRYRSVTLIPDNFKLPANPTGKHAHITWEGDDTLGTDGEYLEFEGVQLIDGGNPTGNQFNSYSNVQTGFTTYGVDIDEYDISPYLSEGMEQVTTTYSAGQDGVLLTAEIVSVSNIPVADLSVTTSNPTGWQEGSTVTKKFTISNNGPNDVPAQSVEFTTTLPAELSFSGVQGDLNWNCIQSGQTLTCRYQPKLRSGWSDYLDLTFDVANVAPTTANLSVSVNHDNAPYDIFDNQATNDTYQFNVPIVTNAVVDLSASSKTYSNLSGDLLLAGDTLQYVITIDDASDLATFPIQVTDDLPANISGFTVLSIPSGANDVSTTNGGANGTGYLDIRDISLPANDTVQIVLEVYLNSNAPEGASLQNTANISGDGNNWIVDTGDITVVEPDFSTSTKEAEDVNGGWALPDETVRYTITLDETDDLETTGLQVIDHLPEYISSFNIVSMPAGAVDYSVANGGNNNTGLIDIRDIYLAAGSTAEIIIDATIASDAPDTTPLKNTVTIQLNSASWDIESNDLNVTLSNNTPASGNKPLYLSGTDLTRNVPSTNTERNFRHGDTLTWAITPELQSDLSLTAGDMRFNLAVEGYRTGGVTTQFDVTLYYNDNVGGGNITLATGTIPFGNYRVNTFYDISTDLTLAADTTIPAGSSIYVAVYNQSSNNNANQWSQIDVQTFNGAFFSEVILNASTVINVDNITVWDATYGDPLGSGDGNQIPNSQPDTNLYIRAQISDPFGAFDISSAQIAVTKADGSSYDFSSHPDGNQDLMNPVDDAGDDTSTASKIFEKEITLLEDGESIGWWTIDVTGFEGLEVAPDQVFHQNITTFQIMPFLPNIAISKSVSVINDPINGTTNPKAIPGAELQYSINAINTGRGRSDAGTIILQDQIPANSELYIGNLTCTNRGPGTGLGPVCFNDGNNPNESGLTYNFVALNSSSDHISFSQDGTDFNYEPVDGGDGYDSTVRYIRITPTGEYNNQPKNSTVEPEFNFTYQVKLQ